MFIQTIMEMYGSGKPQEAFVDLHGERERESGRVAVSQLPGHSPCPYFLNGSLSNCEPIYKLRRGVASRGCRIYVVY